MIQAWFIHGTFMIHPWYILDSRSFIFQDRYFDFQWILLMVSLSISYIYDTFLMYSWYTHDTYMMHSFGAWTKTTPDVTYWKRDLEQCSLKVKRPAFQDKEKYIALSQLVPWIDHECIMNESCLYHATFDTWTKTTPFIHDKCLFRVIGNSRGCFTIDLQSTNCITSVATNSWTPGIFRYNRMHLSDREISLMLRKAKKITEDDCFQGQKLWLKFQNYGMDSWFTCCQWNKNICENLMQKPEVQTSSLFVDPYLQVSKTYIYWRIACMWRC